MSQKALSMRKIKEVLRLRYDLGLLQNEIARGCSIGQASVHRYLERASAAGLSWPLPEDCDDRRLNELLFPAAPSGGSPSVRGPVDFAVIHHQLQSNPVDRSRKAMFSIIDRGRECKRPVATSKSSGRK
jgi:hypothetical protein